MSYEDIQIKQQVIYILDDLHKLVIAYRKRAERENTQKGIR